ncbi:MAG: hypothetical protein JNK65_09675 [Deltaproteobacteria bacterium]|nr:hypothetical protein [Deltaproteobacteria bacterium]
MKKRVQILLALLAVFSLSQKLHAFDLSNDQITQCSEIEKYKDQLSKDDVINCVVQMRAVILKNKLMEQSANLTEPQFRKISTEPQFIPTPIVVQNDPVKTEPQFRPQATVQTEPQFRTATSNVQTEPQFLKNFLNIFGK